MVWAVLVTEVRKERKVCQFVTEMQGMGASRCAMLERDLGQSAVWEAARPSKLDRWG